MNKFVMVLVAALSMSATAFADGGSGENSPDLSNPEVRASLGLGPATVVGGGCVAHVIGSGENQEIVYTGACTTAPTSSRRYIQSDYSTVFKTHAAAQARCNQKDQVTGSYSWRGEFRGYVCQELGNTDGGSGN